MSPTFFLKSFGISHVSVDDDSGPEQELPVDPPKIPEKPKISPLHYIVSHEIDADRFPSDVYVVFEGDVGSDSDGFKPLVVDSDGDAEVLVTIDNKTWLKKDIYVRIGEDVKRVPTPVKKIDDDGDIEIDVTKLVEKKLSLFSIMTKLVKPDNPPQSWYLDKYYYDGKGKMSFRGPEKWVPVLMPVTDEFTEGVYVFA